MKVKMKKKCATVKHQIHNNNWKAVFWLGTSTYIVCLCTLNLPLNVSYVNT